MTKKTPTMQTVKKNEKKWKKWKTMKHMTFWENFLANKKVSIDFQLDPYLNKSEKKWKKCETSDFLRKVAGYQHLHIQTRQIVCVSLNALFALFCHSCAEASTQTNVRSELETWIWHMQALKLDNWPPISNKNIALNRNLSPHGIWPKDTKCNGKFDDRRPTRRQWCENHTGMTPCKVILLLQQLRSGEA